MAITTDVEEATIVHISVKMEDGDWVLRLFPSRPGDTIAFFNTKPKKFSPERPHKVVWVSHGLEKDMMIRITEKPDPQGGYSNVFKKFELTPKDQLHEEKPAASGTWRYKIEFFQDTTVVNPVPNCVIDPDVVVHPDP